MKEHIIKWFTTRKRELLVVLYFVISRIASIFITQISELVFLDFIVLLSTFLLINIYDNDLIYYQKNNQRNHTYEQIPQRKVPLEIIMVLDYLFSIIIQFIIILITINLYSSIISDLFFSNRHDNPNEWQLVIINNCLIPFVYFVLFFFRAITWILKKYIGNLISANTTNRRELRKLIYSLSVLFLFIILFTSVYITRLLSNHIDFSIILGLALFIFGFGIGIIVNSTVFILLVFCGRNLVKFEFSYKCETSILSLLRLDKLVKFLKSHRFIGSTGFILCFFGFLLIRAFCEVLIFDNSLDKEEAFVFGIISGLGDIFLLISLFLLFWLILRTEDIITIVDSLHFSNGMELQINNVEIDKKVKDHVKKIKKDKSNKENDAIWRISVTRKFQYLLDGLDNLLVGSLPICLFGISLYSCAMICINFELFMEEEFNILDSILLISSIFTLVSILLYQGSRQFLIRKMKKLLKDNSYDDNCHDLLKNHSLYLEKPDIITSTILLLIPVITFLIRFFPILLKSF